MSEPPLLPPLEQITPNNHGATVSIVAFVLLSPTILTVLAKVATMVYLKRCLLSVDLPIWACTITALIQSILIQHAVDNGMGRHRGDLSSSAFDAYNKFNYAAQLLFILVLFLSKLSTTNLIGAISPNETIQRWCMTTHVCMGAWAVLAVFALAFQCQPPYWEYSPTRCVAEGAIVFPIMIINMILDASLVATSTLMLWHVQMPRVQRLKVSAAFASRAVVIVLGVIQLLYLPKYLRSDDPTFFPNSKTLRAIMNCSIITACIPSLYRFINSLALGTNTVYVGGTELSSGAGFHRPKASASGSGRVRRASSTRLGSSRESSIFTRVTTVGNHEGCETESMRHLRDEAE
ncbi:uncharacterized protein ACLA_023060 [Aspergillus clavatus NRRL 1]|uniref:Rhodopsin domain-containing protein n=1 Tax=Aspergillus clavatus (strain ATCC 1007 / CBS 513.65 / DSM 816 / NCTC 3887 / NRRL 1 / QM 1276 / 107) TaxID=344612 RepID=A1CPM1_ASPCL|nr:uncharacterized protein ACLA_023060 [Aspergillus clavatus NRRL 1]EAW07592.1 conserved hypothetical protein [Aspergillus clavatus NRRL 1]